MIKNCYGTYDSEGYILFSYQISKISFERYLEIGGMCITKEYIDVVVIKDNWCIKLDDARRSISKHASSIQLNEQYVVLSYYYLGLGEYAICLLNKIKNNRLPASIQHRNCLPYYQYLVAPTNLIVSSRIKDIVSYYKQGYISLEKLEECIVLYQLSQDEIVYMYARCVYPSDFLLSKNSEDIKVEMVKFYQEIEQEQEKIKALHQVLSKYVSIPMISWI